MGLLGRRFRVGSSSCMRPRLGERYVVYEEHVAWVAVEYAQVFYIESLFSTMASLPKKPMRNKLPLRIQIIHNNISITLVTSRKHNQLKILTKLPQTVHSIRSDIDPRLNLRIIGESNFKGDIMRFLQRLVTMY